MSAPQQQAQQHQVASDASPVAHLFQRAHQKMTQLTRIDEQFAALLAKRKSLQEDLRTVQAEINQEFDRQLEVSSHSPARARVIATPVEASRAPRRNGTETVQFAAELIATAADAG